MAMKTVRCYEIKDSNLLWEEMVTYDDNHWEYTVDSDKTLGVVQYLGESSKIFKKPEGMTHCRYTFSRYRGTHLDLSSFDTSNVIDMCEMFRNCNSLKSLDLSSFDTSNVTDMNGMFYDCYSLQSLDLSNFDTSNVTDMGSMFSSCRSLQSLDLSSFNTSNVEAMDYMFSRCESLQSLDLSSSFDTSNVTNMHGMFSRCESLQSLDLSSFDTSNVTDMEGMFCECESLQSLDLSSFNISNITNMKYMFDSCKSLKSLDLSNFDASKVKGKSTMFHKTKLNKKNTGLGLSIEKPKIPNVCNKDSIFNEIDDLSHNGNVSSPTSMVKELKSRGYSDSEVVNAIYLKIELGSLDRKVYTSVVDSYVMKVIVPLITKYFSNRSVGEVLDILYKKYPEDIVNKAMCNYLRSQYLVD